MHIGHRRQDHAGEIAARGRQGIAHRQRGALVVAGGEAARHMAGPNAHHQHDGRIRRLGQGKAMLHRLDDGGQIRARVQQPELRLHRKGVAAFLHDGRAFAVILAQDDQRAAGDTRRGQVRQRVRRHIDADRPLEGHRAPDRVMHRGRQHGRRCRFVRIRLEPHAKLAQQVLGIGQHIHQVADRRALIAADIAHAIFQQGLGQRQNAFTGKGFPRPQTQVFDFCLERPFGHARPLQKSCLRILPSIFCSVATKARRSSSGMPWNIRA